MGFHQQKNEVFRQWVDKTELTVLDAIKTLFSQPKKEVKESAVYTLQHTN